MISTLRYRLTAPLVLAASLIAPLAPAALACSFHGFTPEPTLVDRLLMSEDILLASTNDAGAAQLLSLRGQPAPADLVNNPRLIAALEAEPRSAQILVRDDSYGPWIRAAAVTPAFRPVLDDILARLPDWDYDDGSERARHFAGLLDHPDAETRLLALDELDIVTYDRLQNAVAGTAPELLTRAAESGAHPVSSPVAPVQGASLLPSEAPADDPAPLVLDSGFGDMTEQSLSDMDWTDFQQDMPTALVTGPDPIRILLAGLSRDGAFSAPLRDGVAATIGQQTPLLGAYATAWMELDGPTAAASIADRFLSDPTLDTYSLEMLVQALSLHSTSGTAETQAALRDGLGRAMLANPAVAESAARQFGLRWDWSLQAPLSKLLRSGAIADISDVLMIAQYVNLAQQDGVIPALDSPVDTTPLENLKPLEADDGF